MKAQNITKTVLGFISLGLMGLVSCGDGGQNTADGFSGNSNMILGAGATFPYPLYSKMLSEYQKSTGLKVNYQSIGSGGGILQLTNKTVDFGASDAPLNEEQTEKMRAPALHIPITLGAVVVSYNLPELQDTLKLNPELLAEIFLGKIKKWNDPKIAAVNKNIPLPSYEIIVAHRSDGSGTTNVFTDYLSKVNPDWAIKVGTGSAVNWPAGLGGKGNEGVAGLIKQTPGALGYIELAYALQNKMAFAMLKNSSGNYITPSVASTTASANVPLPDDSKISLTNTSAPDGYPITGFSWILIYKDQNYDNRKKERAEKLINLIWWMTHEGQQYSEELHYAPLPEAAVSLGENILKSATFDSQPIKN
jgi:phosphate transport system substrate-binding protein